MEICEKVFGNMDLVRLILKYLNLDDQLSFAQVNEQFRNAYEHYPFNIKYSSMCIHCIKIPSSSPNGIVDEIEVYAQVCSISTYLKYRQLEDYLEVNGAHVKDLMLIKLESPLCHNVLSKCPNIRKLTIYNTNCSPACEMCPADLQELNIFHDSDRGLAFIDTIRGRLKDLRKLQISSKSFIYDTTDTMIKLCYMPQLEDLKLKFRTPTNKVCLTAAKRLQRLEVTVFNIEGLKRLPLQYLKVLHLSIDGYPYRRIPLSILTENCAVLEILTLDGGIFYEDMPLTLPPKVTHLSFLNCCDLTHLQLKRILTEFPIMKFRSHNTSYSGEFHDFKISSHIKSLEIDFIEMTKFRCAYENNSQLKQLKWGRAYPIYSPSTEIENVSNDVSFDSSPNLQRLEIPFMPRVGAFNQLNTLQCLTLNIVSGGEDWCEIMYLLQHPSLQELTLHCMYGIHYLYEVPQLDVTHMMLDQCPVNTNITRLTLTPHILRKWMAFWLYLFTANVQLTLVCTPIEDEMLTPLARKLVQHADFPTKLKTIYVGCVTVDCEELKPPNYLIIQPKLIKSKNYTAQKVWLDLNMESCSRIILSWNNEYN